MTVAGGIGVCFGQDITLSLITIHRNSGDAPPLLHLLERLLGQLLPEDTFQHLLLPTPLVADADQYARRDVTRDAAAQENGRQRLRPRFVRDTPRATPKGDLEGRVTVQQRDDGDEQADREGRVCGRLVGFVEGVGFAELRLVVREAALLERGQDEVVGQIF